MNVFLYANDLLTVTLVTETLARWGYSVKTLTGNIADLKMVEKDAQIILIDMPVFKETGIQNCRLLEKSLYPAYCHIILLGDKNHSKLIKQTLEAGADDFLLKPINQNELWARMNLANRVVTLEQQISKRTSERHSSVSDKDLMFMEVKKLWERSKRDLSPLSVLHIEVSDSQNGDDESLVLRLVRAEISKELRAYDFVGQISDNEILVTLPSSPPDCAIKAAERIKQNCANKLLKIYIGVSSFNENQREYKDLLAAANNALHLARRNSDSSIVFET